jgi:hypothetical protein
MYITDGNMSEESVEDFSDVERDNGGLDLTDDDRSQRALLNDVHEDLEDLGII